MLHEFADGDFFELPKKRFYKKNTYPQKYSYIMLRFISQLLYNDVDSRLSVMHESLHRPYQPDNLKSIHITKHGSYIT